MTRTSGSHQTLFPEKTKDHKGQRDHQQLKFRTVNITSALLLEDTGIQAATRGRLLVARNLIWNKRL